MIITISAIMGLLSSLGVTQGMITQGLFKTAMALYTTLEQDKENQQGWTHLANFSFQVTKLLLSPSETSEHLEQVTKDLIQFHDSVIEYYKKEVLGRPPLMRYLSASKYALKISSFSKQLEALRDRAKLTLLVQIPDIQAALKKDSENYEKLGAQIQADLESNRISIIHELGIRHEKHDQDLDTILTQLQTMGRQEKKIKSLLTKITNALESNVTQRFETFRIDPESIQNVDDDIIGEGGFGVVRKATYFGSPVAVKVLHGRFKNKELIAFRREVNIWKSLNHPNVLQLLGACESPKGLFMVSPFVKNGDLYSYILDTPDVTEEKRLSLLYQVACGVAFLHANNVIHGDLKPQNVLLDDGFNAILCDFGMARTKHTESTTTHRAPNDANGGTVDFMAPELLNYSSGSNRRTDAYAFAVTMYHVLNDCDHIWIYEDGSPMQSVHVVRTAIVSGKRPDRLDHIPDDVWSIIEICWHENPSMRPAFSEDDILSRLRQIMGTPSSDTGTAPRRYDRRSIIHHLSQESSFFADKPEKQEARNAPFFSGDENVAAMKKLHIKQETFHSSDQTEVNGGYTPSSISKESSWDGRNPKMHNQRFHDAKKVFENDSQETLKPPSYHFAPQPPVMVYQAQTPDFSVPGPQSQKSRNEELPARTDSLIDLSGPAKQLAQHPSPQFTPYQKPVENVSSTVLQGHVQSPTQMESNAGFPLRSPSPIPPSRLNNITNAKQQSEPIGQIFSDNLQGANSENVTGQESLFDLAIRYRHGDGLPQNHEEAFRCFQQAADAGHMEAQFQVGFCYQRGVGVPMDEETAFKWFSKSADQGFAAAQNVVAIAYYNGIGTPIDYNKAYEAFRKSADQNNASAQCNLGLCYRFGRGVAPDYRQAFVWFKKSADLGYPNGLNWLGVCYENGMGIYSSDKSKAFEYYKMSAEQGNVADAQYNLGRCYRNGIGTLVDPKLAFEWFQKAALQGHTEAQYRLGRCFQTGSGVEKNQESARLWFEKSALGHNEEAKSRLKSFRRADSKMHLFRTI